MNPYFKDKNFCLYQGDSLKILKRIKDNFVDMIFADPPYFLSNGTFTCQNGKMVSVKKGEWDMGKSLEENLKFHCNWIKECKRVLKPNGTIWISGTYHSIYSCGFALKVAGYKILNDIAWRKPNPPPNLSCRYFTAGHETLIWAIKDSKAKHTFNYSKMRDGNWPEDILKKPNKQMMSVWSINAPQSWEKSFGKHPTQKPFNLLERIVLASTKENDIVLDPFSGSSTTGLAAVVNNRKFVGIDTEKKYLDLSIKRLKEIKNIKLS